MNISNFLNNMASNTKFKIASFMIRTSFGFLSILAIDLLVSFFLNYLVGIDRSLSTNMRTLIGMFAIMILFYFFLNSIDKWTRWVLEKMKSSSQKLMGPYTGIILIVSLLYFLLFLGFHYLWFHRLPFHLGRFF